MRTFSVLFLILVLFFPFEGESTESTSSVQAYFFYSEECPSCGGILHGYLPGLKSTYPFLEIQTLDIKNPTFYESLVQIEKQFGRSGGELPVLIIGDQILSGEQEIMEKLEPLILEFQATGAPPLPPLQSTSLVKPSEKTFAVDLAYFYRKGCPQCDRASYLLKYITKKYPSSQCHANRLKYRGW